MTTLVTGATGNIGRRVVAGLVGAGQRVRAMSRDPEKAAARLPAGVERAGGDFDRPETWADALRGVHRVYLFPGVHLDAAQGEGFIDRAVEAGVRRFVVHSAVAAGFPHQGDPRDPGLTPLQRHLADERQGHRDIELAVEATGAEWTHVRPGLLAAGALEWAGEIRATGSVRAPYPRAAQALTHEADVAEVAVAALLTDDHVGATHTITGPHPVTQLDQVRAIGAATGRAVGFVELTPEQARQEWYDPGQGVDHAVLDWLLELLAASADDPALVPPTGTFERITGRPPRTFAQWACDHAEDFR
ncbi:NAD(P)H-binding protein [Nonomuraea typhae]|uniref:NAD(P)H-binding protein n=1 Tax=Nonomuraea typhae TaxID=2603600 RepID=UPI001CA5F221|nr:NAD(P)H-binding protein [Nonomuraea typhae]